MVIMSDRTCIGFRRAWMHFGRILSHDWLSCTIHVVGSYNQAWLPFHWNVKGIINVERTIFQHFAMYIFSDFCENNVCVNGGSCVNMAESYCCECINGFYGRNCETGTIYHPYCVYSWSQMSYPAVMSTIIGVHW